MQNGKKVQVFVSFFLGGESKINNILHELLDTFVFYMLKYKKNKRMFNIYIYNDKPLLLKKWFITKFYLEMVDNHVWRIIKILKIGEYIIFFEYFGMPMLYLSTKNKHLTWAFELPINLNM